MLYIARFAELSDCIVAAPDPEEALRVLAECVSDPPLGLQEVPESVFCAEIRWADDDEESPANYASVGVVLEPFDAFASYLETKAKSEEVAAHMIAVRPPEDSSG